MISFQGEGLSSSSSSFMLLTKWWVPQCTECDPGTVAAKFVMDEKKPSAGSQNVCLSVCETSVIFSLSSYLRIYICLLMYNILYAIEKKVQRFPKERETQTTGRRRRREMNNIWRATKWPPFDLFKCVESWKKEMERKKKNLGPPWAGNNLQPRGRWPNRAAKRRKIRSSCWPEPSSGSSSLFPHTSTRKMVEFKFFFFHQWPGR